MSVLLAMWGKYPRVIVVETHPKVLYWALEQKKYNYASAKAEMERVLCQAHAATVATANEHEWDAAISAFAAACGVCGRLLFCSTLFILKLRRFELAPGNYPLDFRIDFILIKKSVIRNK